MAVMPGADFPGPKTLMWLLENVECRPVYGWNPLRRLFRRPLYWRVIHSSPELPAGWVFMPASRKLKEKGQV